MNVKVDDIGSFPLPSNVRREDFEKAYELAREFISEGKDIRANEFLFKNFYNVIINSFKMKIEAGLDVANYPQHYDMHKQFLNAIHKAMDRGTYIVEEKMAIIPEVYVINIKAKELYDEIGRKIPLRVCITGPIELYMREIGKIIYRDVLLMFAENVRNFARGAILDSKYIKTEVVSIDEPSFGFQEIPADRDILIEALEKAFDFNNVTKQIHLHSPARIADVLEVSGLDVVSIEYASSPKNLEYVSKSMLEKADKYIRVGTARTDIDTLIAELYEKDLKKPDYLQLVEDKQTIRRRFEKAREKFGERLTFTGPDCGLGGWPSQEIAQLLLRRTVEAVKMF
jgi:5-methyltetrahydropteroyltriglutamate--homocysteine methyltransferase